LKDELLKELKDAMKNKDELKKNTITLLRSAILQVEKDNQKQLTEDEMLAIVSKEVKKRRDSISDYQKAGRDDIIVDLKREIEILSKYLPEQLSNEQIGKVMQNLRPKTNGKADGKIVSEIVKEKLLNM